MNIDIQRLKTDAAYWDGVQNGLFHFTEMKTKRCFGIPRPTKPAAPEYPRMAVMVNPHEAPLHYGEETLGKEIEVIEWLPDESCYVVRFDWGLGVLHDSMVDFGLYDSRTAEQRQRDELQQILEDHLDWSHSKEMSNKATDAIIAAGWKKDA